MKFQATNNLERERERERERGRGRERERERGRERERERERERGEREREREREWWERSIIKKELIKITDQPALNIGDSMIAMFLYNTTLT